MNEHPGNSGDNLSFQRKVWMVCGIIALFVALLWFLKVTFSVFLLILAGSLIALFFHGLATLIENHIPLSRRVSMLLSIILTFVIICSILWFTGAKIQQQMNELTTALPLTINNAKQQLAKSPLGQKILERTSSDEMTDKGYSFISSFFNSTFGAVGDIYIVL